jgi:hypothetical protein
MRKIFFSIPVLIFISCSTSRNSNQFKDKVEILKVDTTSDYYVFSTSDTAKYSIVIAEKGKVNGCKPFKKFIIIDSIKTTSKIKSGSTYDLIGFNGLIIDGIKIKNKGELAKIIVNCASFTE